MTQDYKRTKRHAIVSGVALVFFLTLAMPAAGDLNEGFIIIIGFLFALNAMIQWAKYVEQYVDFRLKNNKTGKTDLPEDNERE
ncbi:MAG: hypothetical protein FVQ82_12830 [Planctomycetes bacterium]|nr:hypothetical protein [Planctomycetota bacterium]